MPSLSGLSFAHPEVAAGRRARLCLDEGSLRDAHTRLRSSGHDVFLLPTCLRVEIVWSGGPEQASEVLTSIYGDESMSNIGVSRTDWDVFLHLCRIAAGLDSPTVGETEVLSQFRQAVSVYQDSAHGLGRVLEAAIGIGREARRHLGEATNGSLGAVAARAAAAHERVAILGAGAMARSAARLLSGRELRIFARRPGRVAGHETRPWEESVEALATDSVVICTVPGLGPLLTDESVEAALRRRTGRLELIDLGMPPGFESLRDHPAIGYLGIDEVASSVEGRAVPAVEELVLAEAATSWHRLTASDRVGSVIAAMLGQAERAVDQEVHRFAGRLSGADDPEQILRQLAHTVARRVLHPPISYVGSTVRGSEAVEVLAEAFGVSDE